jgi:hypothetical protein
MQSHRAIEIFAGHVIERPDLDDAGVVDQDVDLAETIDGRPDGRVNLIAIEQIAFNRQNFGTAPSEIGFRARELFTIARNECDVPALLANVSRQHEPQPARSTTNQDDFVAQCVSRRANGATGDPRAD